MFQQRLGAADGRGDVGREVREDVDGVEVRAPGFPAELAGTTDGDSGDVALCSCCQDSHEGLSLEGLLIEPSLARDNQIRLGQMHLEVEHLQHQFDARPCRGTQDGHGGKADAPGRSGSVPGRGL